MSGFGNLSILGRAINDTASIGTVIEAFFYGLYCLIFGQYLQVHRKKKRHERSILIYPLFILFLLSSIYFVLNLPQTFWLVLRPGTHEGFIWNVDIISVAIYGFVDFISQAILIYRCWIMWSHLPLYVVTIPIIMASMFLGIVLVIVIELCQQSQYKDLSHLPAWAFPLAICSFCLSLVLNAIVTGLIVFRINMIHIQSRRSMIDGDQRLYNVQVYPIISVLAETGMMTFVSQLLFVIVFGLQSTSTIVIGSPMVVLYGITPTVVIVRATIGNSINNQDRTSRIHSSIAFAANENGQVGDIAVET